MEEKKIAAEIAASVKKIFYQYSSYFTSHKTQIGGNFMNICRYFMQHYYRTIKTE